MEEQSQVDGIQQDAAVLEEKRLGQMINEPEDEEEIEEGESQRCNDINIEVKVSSRKACRSVDTDYDEYIKKYANDDYLSKIETSEENDAAVKDKETAFQLFNLNEEKQPKKDQESDHETSSFRQEELQNEGDERDARFIAGKSSREIANEIEFWRGYGTNIYFQPMTCNMLPLRHIKSKQGTFRRLQHTNRNLQKSKRNLSPMQYQMDVPGMKEVFSDLGTLQIDDGQEGGFHENRPTTGVRVGNFVLSEELRKKLCKGFVCRNFGKYVNVRNAVSLQNIAWENKEKRSINIDVKKIPGLPMTSDGRIFPMKKNEKRKGKHEPCSVSFPRVWSYPNMNPVASRTGKYPRKKVISGKTYHVTNSVQSINKINLLPFKSSPTCHVEQEIKSYAPSRLLHPSPVPDEEEEKRESLADQVVADHLQEMKKIEHVDENGLSGLSNEEHFAYDSVLSYYETKAKASEARTEQIEHFLSTTSLFSEPTNFKKTFKSSGSRGPDHRIERKPVHVATDELQKVHVIGKNKLAPSNSMSSIPNLNERPSELPTSYMEPGNLSIPLFHEFVSTDDSYPNPVNSVDSNSLVNAVDLSKHAEKGKAVHFDEELFDEKESNHLLYGVTIPLEASPAKIMDRYEIPNSGSCRLPIIGQKISTKT